MSENEKWTGSRTVQRSINILSCFTLDEPELTLTEVSNKVGLAKSTTSRLLDTLVHNGLIQKKITDSKYRFGYKMYQFGRIAEKTISFEIIDTAKPYMEKLRNEVGETVSLYILENNKRRCIERYESHQSISHVVNIGKELSLGCGSAGKALLAFQPKSFIESIVNSIEPEHIRKTLTSELPEIRKSSISISLDERGVGANAISSPIVELNQEVNFCLCISGPSTRFTSEVMVSVKNLVKENAQKISYDYNKLN